MRARDSNKLTVAEICEQLHLKKSAVYAILKSGQLKSIRVGLKSGHYLVNQSDVTAYLAACANGNAVLVVPKSQEQQS